MMKSGLVQGLQHRRAWLDGAIRATSRAALGALSRMHGLVAARGRGLHAVVDDVLSAAAHELKTPLSVVRAEAHLLMGERGGDARVASIARQIDRLEHLVEQLLAAARLPFGGAPTAVAPTDLTDLVAAVARRFDRSARRHRIRLSPSSAASAWVRVDPERIALAVANLIDNAIRYSPQGGTIEVDVRTAPGEALVAVRDHGIGIPLARQRRLFEALYRAHAGTPDDRGGIGIGLAITRHIVASHGGTVWFRSATGRGSTFAFSLPLV
jgi:two-component system, OmpR family, phosphate regulon sensor histidine kinase PhoR